MTDTTNAATETATRNDALLNDVAGIAADAGIEETRMDLDDIFISKSQNVRDQGKGYKPEAMGELANSIRGVGGLLQPLVIAEVEPSEQTEFKSYTLLIGFRRALCLQALAQDEEGWDKNVPVRVVDPGTPQGLRAIQLVENMNRSDLTPLEISDGIHELLSEGVSASDVSEMLGVTETKVSQYRKLADLTAAAREALDKEEISFSHARVLLYDIYPNVDRKRWDDFLKWAKEESISTFALKGARYKKGAGADSPADATVSTGAAPTDKPQSIVLKTPTAKAIEHQYLPFLDGLIKKADETEKKYTAHDLLEARRDTILTLVGHDNTKMAKVFQPYLKEQEEKEKAEKAKKDAGKNKDKYFKDLCKAVETLFNEIPDDPEAPRPALAECIATVAEDALEKVSTEEAKTELGFPLETDDKDHFVRELNGYWQEKVKADRKRAADLKAAREKRRKEKEAAEAKEKAEQEKAEPTAGSDKS